MPLEFRVRVLGDLSLLPDGVKKAAATVMKETAGHTNLTLNICFSYTSGEEISSTIRQVVQAARRGEIEKEDIDEQFLSNCLYTRGSSPDLLARTSGETRLSDFLTWQCNRAHLCFLDCTWPEIDMWRFLTCVWDYQAHAIVKDPRKEPVLRDAASDDDDVAVTKLKERKRRQDKYLSHLEQEELDNCIQWM
jgi:ditrans,polycis-polyprenyl diphosphate synthase